MNSNTSYSFRDDPQYSQFPQLSNSHSHWRPISTYRNRPMTTKPRQKTNQLFLAQSSSEYSHFLHNNNKKDKYKLYDDAIKMKSIVNNLKREIALGKSEINQKNKEIHKKDKIIEEARRDSEVNSSKLMKKIKETDNLSRLKNQFRLLKSELAKVNQLNEEYKNQIKHSRANEYKMEAEAKRNELANLVESYQACISDIIIGEEQLRQCKIKAEIFNQQHQTINQYENDLREAKLRTSQLKNNINKLNDVIISNQAEIKKKKIENNNLKSQNEKLLLEKKNRENFILQKPLYEKKINELEEQIAEYKNQIASNNAKIKELNKYKDSIGEKQDKKVNQYTLKPFNYDSFTKGLSDVKEEEDPRIALLLSMINESQKNIEKSKELIQQYEDYLNQLDEEEKASQDQESFVIKEKENEEDPPIKDQGNNNNNNNEEDDDKVVNVEEINQLDNKEEIGNDKSDEDKSKSGRHKSSSHSHSSKSSSNKLNESKKSKKSYLDDSNDYSIKKNDKIKQSNSQSRSISNKEKLNLSEDTSRHKNDKEISHDSQSSKQKEEEVSIKQITTNNEYKPKIENNKEPNKSSSSKKQKSSRSSSKKEKSKDLNENEKEEEYGFEAELKQELKDDDFEILKDKEKKEFNFNNTDNNESKDKDKEKQLEEKKDIETNNNNDVNYNITPKADENQSKAKSLSLSLSSSSNAKEKSLKTEDLMKKQEKENTNKSMNDIEDNNEKEVHDHNNKEKELNDLRSIVDNQIKDKDEDKQRDEMKEKISLSYSSSKDLHKDFKNQTSQSNKSKKSISKSSKSPKEKESNKSNEELKVVPLELFEDIILYKEPIESQENITNDENKKENNTEEIMNNLDNNKEEEKDKQQVVEVPAKKVETIQVKEEEQKDNNSNLNQMINPQEENEKIKVSLKDNKNDITTPEQEEVINNEDKLNQKDKSDKSHDSSKEYQLTKSKESKKSKDNKSDTNNNEFKDNKSSKENDKKVMQNNEGEGKEKEISLKEENKSQEDNKENKSISNILPIEKEKEVVSFNLEAVSNKKEIKETNEVIDNIANSNKEIKQKQLEPIEAINNSKQDISLQNKAEIIDNKNIVNQKEESKKSSVSSSSSEEDKGKLDDSIEEESKDDKAKDINQISLNKKVLNDVKLFEIVDNKSLDKRKLYTENNQKSQPKKLKQIRSNSIDVNALNHQSIKLSTTIINNNKCNENGNTETNNQLQKAQSYEKHKMNTEPTKEFEYSKELPFKVLNTISNSDFNKEKYQSLKVLLQFILINCSINSFASPNYDPTLITPAEYIKLYSTELLNMINFNNSNNINLIISYMTYLYDTSCNQSIKELISYVNNILSSLPDYSKEYQITMLKKLKLTYSNNHFNYISNEVSKKAINDNDNSNKYISFDLFTHIVKKAQLPINDVFYYLVFIMKSFIDPAQSLYSLFIPNLLTLFNSLEQIFDNKNEEMCQSIDSSIQMSEEDFIKRIIDFLILLRSKLSYNNTTLRQVVQLHAIAIEENETAIDAYAFFDDLKQIQINIEDEVTKACVYSKYQVKGDKEQQLCLETIEKDINNLFQ